MTSNTGVIAARQMPYRDSMQAKRADIMAKALTLSANQAAKFWPMFEKYQK